MADLDLSSGTGIREWTGAHQAPGPFILYNLMDFSANNADASATVSAIAVPAKVLVQKVVHIVKTAEGGTSTGTIGDSDPDGWIDTVDNNASAGTLLSSDGRPVLSSGTPNTFASFTNAYYPGKYYATADTIDMVLSANALDTAVILLLAYCVDLSELM